jgi:hypothetical protein
VPSSAGSLLVSEASAPTVIHQTLADSLGLPSSCPDQSWFNFDGGNERISLSEYLIQEYEPGKCRPVFAVESAAESPALAVVGNPTLFNQFELVLRGRKNGESEYPVEKACLGVSAATEDAEPEIWRGENGYEIYMDALGQLKFPNGAVKAALVSDFDGILLQNGILDKSQAMFLENIGRAMESLVLRPSKFMRDIKTKTVNEQQVLSLSGCKQGIQIPRILLWIHEGYKKLLTNTALIGISPTSGVYENIEVIGFAMNPTAARPGTMVVNRFDRDRCLDQSKLVRLEVHKNLSASAWAVTFKIEIVSAFGSKRSLLDPKAVVIFDTQSSTTSLRRDLIASLFARHVNPSSCPPSDTRLVLTSDDNHVVSIRLTGLLFKQTLTNCQPTFVGSNPSSPYQLSLGTDVLAYLYLNFAVRPSAIFICPTYSSYVITYPPLPALILGRDPHGPIPLLLPVLVALAVALVIGTTLYLHCRRSPQEHPPSVGIPAASMGDLDDGSVSSRDTSNHSHAMSTT